MWFFLFATVVVLGASHLMDHLVGSVVSFYLQIRRNVKRHVIDIHSGGNRE
jgi:hypothetical protein